MRKKDRIKPSETGKPQSKPRFERSHEKKPGADQENHRINYDCPPLANPEE